MKMISNPIYNISFLAIVLILTTSACQKKEGCTDSAAKNYNAEAILDDGTCTYLTKGCTDETAANYNPLAEVDDGSCRSDKDDDDDDNGNGNGNGNGNSSDPQPTQGVFLLKWTGVQCGPCGSTAHDKIEDILAISPNVHAFEGHVGPNDPMNNLSGVNWLRGIRDLTGTPKIYIHGPSTDSAISYSSYSENPHISDLLAGNCMASSKLELDTATGQVTGKVKFFDNGTASTYHLSIYILENNIPGGSASTSDVLYHQYPVSQNANYMHNHTFRTGSMNAGVNLGTNPTSGDMTQIDETFTLDATWNKANLEVIGVIWEEDSNGDFFFINVN